MRPNKNGARLAGLLYFIYIITHILSDAIGRSKLIVYGDAAATAQNKWPLRGNFVDV
ncbi:MAG: hypothetical protein IAF02_23565 [Anaerolineae bacterium]|nr:hypothetical protein [Anaerolineae bacterium]